MPRGPGYLPYGALSKAEDPSAARPASYPRDPADFSNRIRPCGSQAGGPVAGHDAIEDPYFTRRQ